MKTENTSRDLVVAAMEKSTIKGTLAGLKTNDIQTALSAFKAQISQALPKHLTAERIIQMAVTLISRNPKIAKCTYSSLVGAIMQASILGFQPVEALGECYFVPRSVKKKTGNKEEWVDEVCFEIGYKGYIKLGQNSGQLKTIYSEAIYAGDYYKIVKGLNADLQHEPKYETDSIDDLIGTYAVAHYINGGYNFVFLPKKKIEKYRLLSPAQKKYGLSGIWKDNYEEMAKKTAIRRLSDVIPKSSDIQNAFISDGAIIKPESFTNDHNGVDLDQLEYPKEEQDDSWINEFDGTIKTEESKGEENHA